MAKQMTQREKKQRAAIRKELQAKGIIPPAKPRLNREKYIEAVKKEWNNRQPTFLNVYLMEAFSYMIGHMEHNSMRLSQEAIGAAKVLKIAMRLQEFHKKLLDEGRTEYTVKEEYDCVKNILEE